jgi:hypothetical protein
MQAKMPVYVMAYGAALIILSLVVYFGAPDDAQVSTAVAGGVIGGVICLALGGAGMAGWRYRAWTMLAVAGISYVLLSQVIINWLGENRGEGLFVPVALTLMLIMSIGFVAYFAQAASNAPERSLATDPR